MVVHDGVCTSQHDVMCFGKFLKRKAMCTAVHVFYFILIFFGNLFLALTVIGPLIVWTDLAGVFDCYNARSEIHTWFESGEIY